ncbi:MAG TPA: hypothetical protein VJX67_22730 [Blastocatellia bacterium]|nr:hypothetical protein [Blastocatellia bacterium]
MTQDVIDCSECLRKTPAGRGKCIYCGAMLLAGSISTAPTQRPIESFERAFNTILAPARAGADERVEESLASALGIEIEEARAFIAAGKHVPISRSQTRHEAELVAALVRTCGLGATVVDDVDLEVETALIRARRVVIEDGIICMAHVGGKLAIPLSSVSLIVAGLIRNNRVDYIEGRSSGRGDEGNVLDSTEYRSDLMLMDVYGSCLAESFRIRSDGFDYSGLVNPLSFRAELNFQAAARALSLAAPMLMVDDGFSRIRHLLSRAWPERTRTEARGITRAGPGYALVARASLIRDNQDQFDRYSRLVYFLSKGAPANVARADLPRPPSGQS